MTTIVALVDKEVGDTLVGMDGVSNTGRLNFPLGKAPVRAAKWMLLAVAGSTAISNALQDYDDKGGRMDIAVANIRQFLLDSPAWPFLKDEIGRLDGRFIIATPTEVALVGPDFGFGVVRSGEMAIGSGGEIALGALMATRGMAAEERVRLALEAAAEYDDSSGPPFSFTWVIQDSV